MSHEIDSFNVASMIPAGIYDAEPRHAIRLRFSRRLRRYADNEISGI